MRRRQLVFEVLLQTEEYRTAVRVRVGLAV
jgi:hypothetical protein